MATLANHGTRRPGRIRWTAESPPQGSQSAGGVGFHHQSRASAGDMGYHRRAAVQFGDGTKVDGEGQFDLLSFSKSHARGSDEHSGGTEVYGFAQRPASVRHDDVHQRPCPMSGV